MTDFARFEKENPKTAAFIKERNAHVALVLNIESRAAIRDMEKMLAVPGAGRPPIKTSREERQV